MSTLLETIAVLLHLNKVINVIPKCCCWGEWRGFGGEAPQGGTLEGRRTHREGGSESILGESTWNGGQEGLEA